MLRAAQHAIPQSSLRVLRQNQPHLRAVVITNGTPYRLVTEHDPASGHQSRNIAQIDLIDPSLQDGVYACMRARPSRKLGRGESLSAYVGSRQSDLTDIHQNGE